MLYLTTVETAVLEQLAGRDWRTPMEIHTDIDGVGIQVIRSGIRQLLKQQLIERGGWGHSNRWGDYRITDAGLQLLRERRQLTLLDGGASDAA